MHGRVYASRRARGESLAARLAQVNNIFHLHLEGRSKMRSIFGGNEPEARAGERASGSVLPPAVLAYGSAEAGPQGFGASRGDLGGIRGESPKLHVDG